MITCTQCKILIKNSQKYCSNKCQNEWQFRTYITKWKRGKVSGGRGINARDLSKHVRRYLLEKYLFACVNCGWNQKHPITNEVLLEVDHIDGDAENNLETNLRVLCPNCHSMTSNYRNRNYGKGRKWRKSKYIKNNVDMPA